MGWVKLSEAAQNANAHISNVRRKLKRLRQINPELYNKIVKKEGTEYRVLRREFVAFLNTDLRRLKPHKVKGVRTVPRDKTRQREAVDPEIKKMVEMIVKQPVVLSVEPNMQQIFDSCPNSNYELLLKTNQN